MNVAKKKDELLKKEIRKLKRDLFLLKRENQSLKETNMWLKQLVDTYKKDIEKVSSYKCDHKFIDGKQCVKCGWMP